MDVAGSLIKLTAEVSRAVDMVCASLADSGQLFVAGNGGSAADAQHIAAELTGRFKARASTAAGNGAPRKQLGFDKRSKTITGMNMLFARELSAHARPGDILLATLHQRQ